MAGQAGPAPAQHTCSKATALLNDSGGQDITTVKLTYSVKTTTKPAAAHLKGSRASSGTTHGDIVEACMQKC
jgi:hypothetical protein